jgi:hypothetical protein
MSGNVECRRAMTASLRSEACDRANFCASCRCNSSLGEHRYNVTVGVLFGLGGKLWRRYEMSAIASA